MFSPRFRAYPSPSSNRFIVFINKNESGNKTAMIQTNSII